jgi:hypothetical protein
MRVSLDHKVLGKVQIEGRYTTTGDNDVFLTMNDQMLLTDPRYWNESETRLKAVWEKFPKTISR